MDNAHKIWPALPLEEWVDTYATLHMWSQVVGKVRLAYAPATNHWWQSPLYLTAWGMTTSPVPANGKVFQIDFDFIEHRLLLRCSTGERAELELIPRSVAEFYREVMDALDSLGIHAKIWTRPVEIEHPVPFERDREHASYNPEHANRFWRVLLQVDRVFKEFRSRFIGKCSPVHFFWGSFDLAVTRFSGRRAPPHPGGIPNLADWVTRASYSRECSSCGFWPGSGAFKEPAFYSYAYPEPEGFKDYPVRATQAFYSEEMKEFLLPYDAVRTSDKPEKMLLDFLQDTYEAAAERGGWNREHLEHDYPAPAQPVEPNSAAKFPEHRADDPTGREA